MSFELPKTAVWFRHLLGDNINSPEIRMNSCRFIPSLISRAISTIRPVQLATMSSSASSARKLEGKVAVVTASTDGIGYAIARRLGEDGAHVVVSSRKKNNVDQAVSNLTKEGLSVSGIVCHVAKAEDRKALFDHAVSLKGGVDILISNAAVNPFMGRLLDTPEDAWEKILQINVTAAFLLTKEVVPIMEKRGGGSIVYVTSIAGFQPFDALAAYSVSKTALLGLTKAAAVHAVDSNVRINCIAPGIVKTKFSQALWVDEAVGDEVKKSIPLKRFGEPKEIAGVVSFLCSDDAAYITGENIVVAGGMQSRL